MASRDLGAWQQVIAPNQSLESPGQLFVPPPRELVRPLVRAQKAIKDQDYQTAVDLLGAILATPQDRDFLQGMAGDPYRFVSVHKQAHLLLSQVPSEQRKDYELRYQVTARQMLEQAVSKGDYGQMAQVARRYFFTEAGYQATLMLGHHYLEMGQPVSAASCFSSLLADEVARQKYDPEISIMLATCKLLSGNRADAQVVLEELKALQPDATVRLVDREVPLFDNPKDALPWLTALIGSSDLMGYKALGEWLMFRGDAERNAPSGTGFPLAYPDWFVPTVNEPKMEKLAESVFQKRLASSECLIPALQPIAVGETIVVRSLDNMIGINARTGKRIWAFPAWERNGLLKKQPLEQSRDERMDRDHVEQRVWQDHLFGQIASNGEMVFVIDQPGYAAGINQQTIIGRGIAVDDPLGGRTTNELKAIDLAREGAFCWEAGGKTGGTSAELAGCFFLGAPLVLENELYVLGELDGEIILIVLDQQTGALIWSQPIAAIDSTPPVNQDRRRRLSGATPSCSNGIIVCPTSATGIVAVDRTTRSLLWGFQYPGTMSGLPRVRNRQPRPNNTSNSIDATVTIAEGRVIVMPREYGRVLCLDLTSGELLWFDEDSDGQIANLGVPSNDGLFVACVFQGKVIVVGQTQLTALDLNSGTPVWQSSLADYGVPTGRGFMSDGHYFLPTSESKIINLELGQGTIGKAISTRHVMGNLICYQDKLVSQGFDRVSLFPQALPVRKFVEKEIQRSRDSGSEPAKGVLVLQAQLMAQDGELETAVAIADRAFQESRQRHEQRLLMDLILELMERDYPAVRTTVAKYDTELRTYSPQRFEAALVAGLLDDGSLLEALSVLKDSDLLSSEKGSNDSVSGREYRNVENSGLRIRLDVWLRKQFKDALVKVAAAGTESSLNQWLEANLSSLTPEQIGPFIEWLGTPLVPKKMVLGLAVHYVSDGQFTKAERLLDRLLEQLSEDALERPDIILQRNAIMLRVAQESGWDDQASAYAEKLKASSGGDALMDPWTGTPISASEFTDRYLNSVPTEPEVIPWNYGEVAGEMEPLTDRGRFLIRSLAWPELICTTGDPPENLRFEVNFQDSTLTIRDPEGAVIGEVPYRDNPDSRNYYSPRMYNGSYALHGHLLIFAYGYDLVAVDLNVLRQGGSALLWLKNLRKNQGVDNRLQLQTGYQAKSINQPWGQPKYVIFGRGEKPNPIGNFASNAKQVFCRFGRSIQCLDALTGELIWQRNDLNHAGWLVANDEYVALLKNRESSPAAQFQSAVVMSAATGEIVKQVDLSEYQGKVVWHNIGLKLLMSGQNREHSLTLFDLVEGREEWNRTWPEDTQAVIRDPHTMVFLQPDRRVQYVDLHDGDIKTELVLEGDSPARTMSIMRFKNQDLILLGLDDSTAGIRTKEQNVSIRAAVSGSIALFNGWIHSVNPETGEMTWTDPIRVQHFSIPQEHPHGSPLLTFNRVVYTGAQTSSGSHNVIEFMTVDLRDGRLVNEFRVRNWALRSIEIVASQAAQKVVHTFNEKRLILNLKRQNFAPATPANLTNELTIPKTKAFASGIEVNLDDLRQQQENIIRDIRERKQDE